MLTCYVCITLRGLESFGIWLFGRILKIQWTVHFRNEEVLRRINRAKHLAIVSY